MQTIDTIFPTVPSSESIGAQQEPRGIFVRISNWVERRAELRRTRIGLLEMSDSQLRDIGVTPEQAAREGNLPWWR